MKTIRVVAAIIKAVNENNEPIIFATQRGYGDFKGGWEFPGGKIEEGETPHEALVREIKEELDTEIKVGELLETVEYDYPTFHLSMDCFWAEIVSGDLVLKEHEAAKWLTKETLDSVAWLPADQGLVEKIGERMGEVCLDSEAFLTIEWRKEDIFEAMKERGLEPTIENCEAFLADKDVLRYLEEVSISAGWEVIYDKIEKMKKNFTNK